MVERMLKFSALVFWMLLIFTPSVSLAFPSEKAFGVILDIYKNDTVELKEFKVVELGVTHWQSQERGNYSFVVSSKEKKLWETKLDITFRRWKEWFDPETQRMYGEPVLVDPQQRYIRLPYFMEASKIELYHLNESIFKYEICQVNNICEEEKGENSINCAQDCLKPAVRSNLLIYGVAIVAVFIAIISLIVAKRTGGRRLSQDIPFQQYFSSQF